MEKEEIGDKIRLALERKKMSQKDLAKVLSVSQSSVTNWIKGYKEIGGGTLLRVLDVLDCYDLFYPQILPVNKSQMVEDEFEALAKQISFITERKADIEIDCSNNFEKEINIELVNTIAKKITAKIVKQLREKQESQSKLEEVNLNLN